MTALNWAVSFVQMHNVAVLVAKNLNFNMTRSLNELLQKHRSVAKRCLGLRARSLERILHFLMSHTHSLPSSFIYFSLNENNRL